jgi:hypothetical protein
MQVRAADKHPTLPAAAGIARGQRVEHEYERKGALCYHPSSLTEIRRRTSEPEH